MNKESLIRQAERLERLAKEKCGHGKSKVWCVVCRSHKVVEKAGQDRFVKHHSFKRVASMIKKNKSLK